MQDSSLFDPEDDDRAPSQEVQIPADSSESPFDQIRRFDERGEYWTGRELMELMAYTSWRQFGESIARAKAAAEATGLDVEENFEVIHKVSGQRGPARQDYRLTRDAAYLVAMNGDPRKSQVAAAQRYFAAQTRKQEIAERAPATVTQIPTHPESLRGWAAAIEAKEAAEIRAEQERAGRMIEQAARQAAEEENAVLLPKAAAADHHRAADGLMTLSDFANKLKAWAIQNLGVRILQKDVFDFLGEIGFICRGNTVRNNRAKAFATDRDFIREKETEYEDRDGNLRLSYTSRLTPAGDGWAWDRAVVRLEQHGSLHKPIGGVA